MYSQKNRYRKFSHSSFIERLEVLAMERAYELDEKMEVTAANLDKIKAFLKKAIIPGLMMLGPVACGEQPHSKTTEQNVEKQLNTSMEQTMSGMTCDVQLHDDGSSTVTFLGKIKDPSGKTLNDKVVISFESHKEDIVNVQIEHQAKTERMNLFQNTLMEAFKDSGRSALEKYDCTFKLPSVNPVK